MKVTTDTSAGRLWNILQQGKEFSLGHQSNPGLKIGTVWSHILDIDPGNEFRVIQAHASITLLVAEVEADIRRVYGEQANLYLGLLKKVIAGLSQSSVAQPWSNLDSHLDDATMSGLALAAQNLKASFAETQISESELQDLLIHIDEMSNNIADSTINPELKIALLQGLEELRRAVVDYKITGSVSVKRAAQQAVGSIALSKDGITTNDEIEKVKKVLDVMDVALKLVGWSCKAYNAIAPMLNAAPIPLPLS